MPLNPNAPAYIPQEVRNNSASFNSMMRNVNAYGNNMMHEEQQAANAANFNAMMRNANNMRSENAAINEAVAIQNAPASSRRRKGRKGRKASRKTRKSRLYNAMGGGVDNMVLQMPKVGYTQLPSDSMGGNAGVLADGKTPFMLNIPYSTSPSTSSACMKGGKRKHSRKSHKKSKKSRKSKKTSRKHRTRKH
jgi:hypothetical protein